jgi:hypothetical protein
MLRMGLVEFLYKNIQTFEKSRKYRFCVKIGIKRCWQANFKIQIKENLKLKFTATFSFVHKSINFLFFRIKKFAKPQQNKN